MNRYSLLNSADSDNEDDIELETHNQNNIILCYEGDINNGDREEGFIVNNKVDGYEEVEKTKTREEVKTTEKDDDIKTYGRKPPPIPSKKPMHTNVDEIKASELRQRVKYIGSDENDNNELLQEDDSFEDLITDDKTQLIEGGENEMIDGNISTISTIKTPNTSMMNVGEKEIKNGNIKRTRNNNKKKKKTFPISNNNENIKKVVEEIDEVQTKKLNDKFALDVMNSFKKSSHKDKCKSDKEEINIYTEWGKDDDHNINDDIKKENKKERRVEEIKTDTRTSNVQNEMKRKAFATRSTSSYKPSSVSVEKCNEKNENNRPDNNNNKKKVDDEAFTFMNNNIVTSNDNRNKPVTKNETSTKITPTITPPSINSHLPNNRKIYFPSRHHQQDNYTHNQYNNNKQMLPNTGEKEHIVEEENYKYYSYKNNYAPQRYDTQQFYFGNNNHQYMNNIPDYQTGFWNNFIYQ